MFIVFIVFATTIPTYASSSSSKPSLKRYLAGRWDNPIKVYTPGLSTAAYRTGVTKAITAWNSKLTTAKSSVRMAETTSADVITAAKVRVWLYEMDYANTGWVGLTSTPTNLQYNSSTGIIIVGNGVSVNVKFNTYSKYYTGTATNKTNQKYGAVAHEFGHVLRLGDMDVKTSVMYYMTQTTTIAPSAYDQESITAKY
jgi:predicted Zn-dependent protease